MSADPVDAAATIIDHWRSDRDFAELAQLDRAVLLEALKIVGEYDSEILVGVTLAALEGQALRAPVVPFRRGA